MGPIFILKALLSLVPEVIGAVKAVSGRSVRPPKPVIVPRRPVHAGRVEAPVSAMAAVDDALRSLGPLPEGEHFWDEAAALGSKPEQVICLYCRALKPSDAGALPCPGPSGAPRAKPRHHPS